MRHGLIGLFRGFSHWVKVRLYRTANNRLLRRRCEGRNGCFIIF